MTMTLVWPIGTADKSGQAILDGLDPDRRAQAEAAAVEFLHNWTGGAFGLQDAVVRPCWTETTLRSSRPWHTSRPTGTWQTILGSVGCGTCWPGDCNCLAASELRFSLRVEEILEVKIDGVVLPAGSYALLAHRSLIRTDEGTWPVTQNLAKPDTEPGTWSVELVYGTPVPEGGKIAAGMLAAEIALALARDPSCRLPQRLQTITRQAVTMTMIDSMDSVTEGRTGIWLVDSWVASVTRAPAQGVIRSPDVPPARY